MRFIFSFMGEVKVLGPEELMRAARIAGAANLFKPQTKTN
jgi:hypothetical protein